MRYAYIIVGVVILLLVVGLAIYLTRQNGGVVAYDAYGNPQQSAYQASILPVVQNDNVIVRNQYPVVSATTPVYQQPVNPAQSAVYSTAVPAYVGYMPMTPMVWYNAPTQTSISYGSYPYGATPTTRVVYGQPGYNYNYQYQYSNAYQPQPQSQVYSYSYGSNTGAAVPASYYYGSTGVNGATPQWSGTWYSQPGTYTY